MKLHHVYLLESQANTRRTYVGYTVDPKKRLRKHNGEIKGGAKYTRHGRPWKMICYIVGFPDNTTALQFEWRTHHPIKSLGKRKPGIVGRLQSMKHILSLPKYTKLCKPTSSFKPLIIVWLDMEYYKIWKTIN
jgi:predicted GIY-YIG superfamily endonuclease